MPLTYDEYGRLPWPTIADLDRDGRAEVILNSGPTEMTVFHFDGTQMTGWPQEVGLPLLTQIMPQQAVGDLDGDGDPEIVALAKTLVVNRADSPLLFAWHPDGNLVAGWPKSFTVDSNSASLPLLADMDHDGTLEIILLTVTTVGGGDADWVANVHVLRHDGSELPGWPVQIVIGPILWTDENGLLTSPAAGDLDGDGNLELVVPINGTDNFTSVWSFHHDGTLVRGWPVEFPDAFIRSLAIGDLDRDGTAEVVMSTAALLTVLHHDGTVASGWPIPYPAGYFSLGDLDGDGDLEVVTNSGSIATVNVWDHAGLPVQGWPQSASPNSGGSGPVLADIDGDGRVDVLLNTGVSGEAYDYGYYDSRVFAWHADGTPLDGFPKETREWVLGEPSLGDLDGDGHVEAVMASATYADDEPESGVGKVFAVDFQGWPGFIEWGTRAHDAMRSGYYQPPLVKNASFEIDTGIDYDPTWTSDDKLAGNNIPDGWAVTAGGVMDPTVAKEGGHSLKLSGTQYSGYAAQDIPIKSNTIYQVSGYVKTDCQSSSCHGTILSECEDSNHNPIWGYDTCQLNTAEKDVVRLFGTNDWTKIEFTVQSNNADAAYLRVLCYNTPRPYTPGTGTVWCDSMQVEAIGRSEVPPCTGAKCKEIEEK